MFVTFYQTGNRRVNEFTLLIESYFRNTETISNARLTIDLRGINQRNFNDKMNLLKQSVDLLLEKNEREGKDIVQSSTGEFAHPTDLIQ